MSAWWDSQPARHGAFPAVLPVVSPGIATCHSRGLCSPFVVGFDDLKGLSQPEWFSQGILPGNCGASPGKNHNSCERSIPETGEKGTGMSSKAGLGVEFRLGFSQPG